MWPMKGVIIVFKTGDIVKHKLTEETLIVVDVDPNWVNVRNSKYQIINVQAEELEKVEDNK